MTEALDHTATEPKARESKNPSEATLWVNDAELIRRLGVPEKIARAALKMYDHDRAKGFPQKNKVWGDRRYWPAVKAFFDKQNGVKVDASSGRHSS